LLDSDEEDNEEESREDNLSVDFLNLSPQSPAPSSSKGAKRRDRSSSPPPNSSRNAAAKKRRVLDLDDEDVEEKSREDLVKEIESLKHKLNKEKKKNDKSVKYKVLKKAFRKLQKEKKETDQEKDILISKLSACAYKCIEHKEDFKKGSTYPQLGYGSTEEDLKNKIVKRVERLKIERQQIFFQEIEHVEEKDITYPCKPKAEEIVFDKSKYKLVVIYKRNHFSKCRDHQFMVVSFIVLDVLNVESATSLRKYFVKNILPKCEGQERECNTKKRPRKNKTEDPKTKDPNAAGDQSKEKGKALKKTTEAKTIEEKASCKCQGEKEKEKGFSLTIGCTKISRGGNKCRFSTAYHSKQPIGRYPLNNYKKWEKKNKHKFIQTVKSLGIKMTKVLKKFAPEAHKNMSKSKPTKCNLARKSVYCSMTMVSDFTAHQHTDKNDVRDGATALLTLLKDDEGEGQYHCLPRYKIKGLKSKKIGVSFRLPHNSVLIEVAALEYHCSTPVPIPNGQDPQRLGLVFFSHKGLDKENHGYTGSKNEESDPETASESDESEPESESESESEPESESESESESD
jgi:hypothetical protein